MRYLQLFIFLIVQFTFSQNTISLKLTDSIPLEADLFIGTDDFENYYFIKENVLFKKTATRTDAYSNFQLGAIASVDITNPLKIIVFYKEFNTIVVLDKRLNELSDSINLTNSSNNTSFVNVASNNNLWLYSLDDNILSLWNYNTKQTIFNSQPLGFYFNNFEASSQISNYEYCWLHSEKGIIKFNEFGSFLEIIKLPSSTAIKPFNSNFTYIVNNQIYLYEKGISLKFTNVEPQHLSTNYFVNKNNLYFFRSNMLYKYRILKN